MSSIKIIHEPSEEELTNMQVRSWPIWTKEPGEFPWHYDDSETCYFLEGEVEVTPKDGKPVRIGVGDLVTFPKGMECSWKINKSVRKYYNFGEL